MIIKHKEQRVGIFIDAQNLYHSARFIHHGRVNFEEVLREVLAGRKLVRAIAYVITTDSGEERGFFDALTKMGIETKTKDLQIFSSGNKKADWDVGLAIDAIKLAPKLDAVIIVSGDGDFIPVIEFLKNSCQVEVAAFGKSASGKLKEVVDDFTDLDLNPEKFILGRTGFLARATGENERPQYMEHTEQGINKPIAAPVPFEEREEDEAPEKQNEHTENKGGHGRGHKTQQKTEIKKTHEKTEQKSEGQNGQSSGPRMRRVFRKLR
jgi:uncharacterized LabA/DUF88 family protein